MVPAAPDPGAETVATPEARVELKTPLASCKPCSAGNVAIATCATATVWPLEYATETMPLLAIWTPCGLPTALPSAAPDAAVPPAYWVSPLKSRLIDKFAAPATVAVSGNAGVAPETMAPVVLKPTVPLLLASPAAEPSRVALQFQFSAAGATPGPAFW